jgi:hypothetical protein
MQQQVICAATVLRHYLLHQQGTPTIVAEDGVLSEVSPVLAHDPLYFLVCVVCQQIHVVWQLHAVDGDHILPGFLT